MLNNSGFLLVNKPSGPTSHDIVNQLRKITGIKRIGHAGTLDPFASGVLLMAVGREATRKISQFVKLDKEYIATLFLGAETDSYDRLGKISDSKYQGAEIKSESIQKILLEFLGEQKQIPPMFSAKKIKGKKLYELARQGRIVVRDPVAINIYEIGIMEYAWPLLKIRTRVSSGTYIRSLASDIGRALGTGAYLAELERTKIGNYDLIQAVTVRQLIISDWHFSFLP
jgi:tRNA pseudouridine55 synthase